MNKTILFFLIALAFLFVSACSDDDGNAVVQADPPQVILTSNDPAEGTILLHEDTIRLSIQATPGTNPLNTLKVFENGERLTNFKTRLFINDSLAPSTLINIALENPARGGFDMDFIIVAPELGGNYDVEIEVADEDGNAARTSYNYFVKDVVEIDAVLDNAEKTDSTGGLDLNTGAQTEPRDTRAEIRDMGNDLTGEWTQRIATIDTNLIEERPMELVIMPSDFNFEGILTKAEVTERFPEGEIVEFFGRKAEVNEVYGVRRLDEYFLFEITGINSDPGSNDDNYSLLIKGGQ